MNEAQPASHQNQPTPYEPPTVEVINLGCEISAYAPDDDDLPLF